MEKYKEFIKAGGRVAKDDFGETVCFPTEAHYEKIKQLVFASIRGKKGIPEGKYEKIVLPIELGGGFARVQGGSNVICLFPEGWAHTHWRTI